MKVALTSDVHLKKRSESPERYNALENIFQKISKKGIPVLIIAGDLFEKNYDNYSDFDELCKKYHNITVYVIPGNHDPDIENRFFNAENIKVITEPHLEEIGKISFLFIPYQAKYMDEVVVDFSHNNTLPDRWILIGHGDYITTNRERNLYETGFYMPLTAKTINSYNPLKVILGHIHKPSEYGKVIYPGSPCGLDINETGRRRFLILDTHSLTVEEETVETDIIYFNETIQMFPTDNEIEYLENRLNKIIQKWQLSNEEYTKVKLRLSLKGYTLDKKAITEAALQFVESKGIIFYDKEGPNTSDLRVLNQLDLEKKDLLNRLNTKIEEILERGQFLSSKDDVMSKVMELILGTKSK